MAVQRQVPRRDFLKYMSILGGAGLVGLAVSPASLFASVDPSARAFYLSRGRRVMLEKVTRSVFSEALNTTFRVKIDGERPIDLSLIEASDLKQPGDLGRKDPFSLIFRGPADLVLPQQTYHMENDKVGKMEIFIVPVGTDDKGTLYQAVFS